MTASSDDTRVVHRVDIPTSTDLARPWSSAQRYRRRRRLPTTRVAARPRSTGTADGRWRRTDLQQSLRQHNDLLATAEQQEAVALVSSGLVDGVWLDERSHGAPHFLVHLAIVRKRHRSRSYPSLVEHMIQHCAILSTHRRFDTPTRLPTTTTRTHPCRAVVELQGVRLLLALEPVC